ncbi:Hexosyltransferase [Caligus rogercresseyi]|uniref:Hexosyltransferase n=1 Tax=Caligus rogercresseyi TaxID=217165 RepID=A0A7T8GPE8_CALRO|nr:Hexosyltransferase [Caligus rogercresseyi]
MAFILSGASIDHVSEFIEIRYLIQKGHKGTGVGSKGYEFPSFTDEGSEDDDSVVSEYFVPYDITASGRGVKKSIRGIPEWTSWTNLKHELQRKWTSLP